MSEMIERVALAIANAKRAKHDIPPCRWEHLTDEAKTEYVGYARAAIEAMREPTDEIVSRAWGDETNKNFEKDEDLFLCAWQLMIDEALK